MEEQNPVIESKEEVSPFSGLVQIFASPTRLFTSLRNKKAWLLPLILTAVVVMVVGHFTRPIILNDTFPKIREMMEKYKTQMPEERYQETMRDLDEQEKVAKENPFIWYYPLIVLGLILVTYFLIASIGWISGNFLYGGKADFWLLMNVVAFASLLGICGDIIRGVMMVMKDSSYVYTGLGMFKPVNDSSFVFYLLRQIDIFSIWRIVATAIGFAAVYRMKTSRFAIIIFTVWGIFIALIAAANIFTGGSIIY